MSPTRNVELWKKRHLVDSESTSIYAEPVPELTSLISILSKDLQEDLLDSLESVDSLHLDNVTTWDVSEFNKISVVTGMQEAAPLDVTFDVDFPASFDFTQETFTDTPKSGERASTPLPMTPDSHHSFNLEPEEPPVAITGRPSDDAESQSSDVFEDLVIDPDGDPDSYMTPTLSESGSVGGSSLKDIAESIPDVVYSSSDSEESAEDDKKETAKKANGRRESFLHRRMHAKGHETAKNTKGHRESLLHLRMHSKSPTFLSFLSRKKIEHPELSIIEIDSEFSGSQVYDLFNMKEAKDEEDSADEGEEGDDIDDESSSDDDDDVVPSPERKKSMFNAMVGFSESQMNGLFNKKKAKDDEDSAEEGDDTDDESSDDDVVPSPERKKSMFHAIVGLSESQVNGLFKKKKAKDDEGSAQEGEEGHDIDDDVSDDDVLPSPERRKTMFYAIRRKKSRDKEDPNFWDDFAEEFFTCSYFFKCLGECAIEEGCSNGREVANETNKNKPVMEMEQEPANDDEGSVDDDPKKVDEASVDEDPMKDDEASVNSASARTATYLRAWKRKLVGKAN